MTTPVSNVTCLVTVLSDWQQGQDNKRGEATFHRWVLAASTHDWVWGKERSKWQAVYNAHYVSKMSQLLPTFLTDMRGDAVDERTAAVWATKVWEFFTQMECEVMWRYDDRDAMIEQLREMGRKLDAEYHTNWHKEDCQKYWFGTSGQDPADEAGIDATTAA